MGKTFIIKPLGNFQHCRHRGSNDETYSKLSTAYDSSVLSTEYDSSVRIERVFIPHHKLHNNTEYYSKILLVGISPNTGWLQM